MKHWPRVVGVRLSTSYMFERDWKPGGFLEFSGPKTEPIHVF